MNHPTLIHFIGSLASFLAVFAFLVPATVSALVRLGMREDAPRD